MALAIRLLRVAVLPATLALGACQAVQTTQPGTVGVDRKQYMLLSAEEVNRAAEQAYAQTLNEAAQKGTLNRDAAQLSRAHAVAGRLIPATSAFRQDAPGWSWEVNVISSPEVNAWCMPGGKIAVYAGIIEKPALTDDELAAVLGHEIAHALREHGRERASQQVATGVVIDAAGRALGAGDTSKGLAGVVASVTYGLPNSREHEREADRIGVELAARAGYDPRAAVTLWQKMSQSAGREPPRFLSTHPSSQSRIEDLQAQSSRVMPLYQQARAAPPPAVAPRSAIGVPVPATVTDDGDGPRRKPSREGD